MRRADQLQGLLVELLRSTMSHHPRRKIEILGEVMHAGGQSDYSSGSAWAAAAASATGETL